MKRLWLLLPVVLIACTATPPAPQDHFYRLSVTNKADCQTPIKDDPGGEILRLDAFRSTGLLRDRSIVYIESLDSAEVDSYDYHLWLQSPDNLVRDHLADYLEQCQLAGRVTTVSTVPAKWSIDGQVEELMHVRASDEVRVALELQLYRRGRVEPVLLHSYREREPVASGEMVAVVAAFNRALERIYERFLTDIDQQLAATE